MKNALFALLICLTATAASAQQVLSFGPVVGVNFSKLSDSSPADTEFNTGLAAGAQLTYSSINKWGLGISALFSREGFDAATGSTDLTYVRIPLRGYLFFGENGDAFRPKLFFGPSLGFLAKAESELAGNKFDSKNAYNSFDLGLAIGAGFNARMSEGIWFNFDLGYTHGLMDLPKNANGENRTIAALVGVMFGF